MGNPEKIKSMERQMERLNERQLNAVSVIVDELTKRN